MSDNKFESSDFEGTFWTVFDGDFYVSTIGSDIEGIGDGSPQRPFLTVKKAFDLSADNEKIIVGPDEYVSYNPNGQAPSGAWAPCRVATTGQQDLTIGLATVDGVTLLEGDCVLVWQQTNLTENGIYVVTTGNWTRAENFDTEKELIAGQLVPVAEGTAHGKTIFQYVTSGTIVLGVSAIAFEKAAITDWGSIQGEIIDNQDLSDALDAKADKSNVLELDNTTSFIPENDYHPATKKFVEDFVAVLNKATPKGLLDCSASPNYLAGVVGDYYYVSVAGKIGGTSGVSVEQFDKIQCIADVAAGDQTAVGDSWIILQGNLDKATQTEAEAGTDNEKYMTALRTKQAWDNFADGIGIANLEDDGANVVNSASGTGSFVWKNITVDNNLIQTNTYSAGNPFKILDHSSQGLTLGQDYAGADNGHSLVGYGGGFSISSPDARSRMYYANSYVDVGNLGVEINTSSGSGFVVNSGGGGLKLSTSGGAFEIELLSNLGAAKITDLRVIPFGLEYTADYSGTYSDRSLVDKAYVNAQINALSGGGSGFNGSYTVDDASINTSIKIAEFNRTTSGTADQNIGGFIDIGVEDHVGSIRNISIGNKLRDADDSSPATMFYILGHSNNASQTTFMEIGGQNAGSHVLIGAGATTTTSTSVGSVVIGREAYGASACVSIGQVTTVGGINSTGVGHFVTNHGNYSFAAARGSNIDSSSHYGIAIGDYTALTAALGGQAYGRHSNSGANGAIMMGYHISPYFNSLTNSFELAWDGIRGFKTGLTLGTQVLVDTDPDTNLTDAENGSIAYDSIDHEFRAYVNGAWDRLTLASESSSGLIVSGTPGNNKLISSDGFGGGIYEDGLTFDGSTLGVGNLSISGNKILSTGDIELYGNLGSTLNMGATGGIRTIGSITPQINGLYDIGSFSYFYNNAFFSGRLHLGNSTNTLIISPTTPATNITYTIPDKGSDQTFAFLSDISGGFSVTNEANNRIITSTGTGTGNAESALIFDGLRLGISQLGGNGVSGGNLLVSALSSSGSLFGNWTVGGSNGATFYSTVDGTVSSNIGIHASVDGNDTGLAPLIAMVGNNETSNTVARDIFGVYNDTTLLDTFSKSGSLFILEKASADTNRANYGQIWVKNDAPNTLWFTDDEGTDWEHTFIQPKVQTVNSSATITASSRNECVTVTALAVDTTVAAPTGTFGDCQPLIFRIKDNAAARTITWNSIFRALGVDLPVTTTPSKTLYISCIYNSIDAKFDVIGITEEG